MLRSLSILALCCACGTASVDDTQDDELTVASTLAPQSFVHGTLTKRASQLAYALHLTQGDVIAPDAWATPGRAGSLVKPTLVLLGPKSTGGHRPVLATAHPRGAGMAIDGFRVPKTGSYLVVVGGPPGTFTLRLWMQSSHLPRQENAQLQLTPHPSDGFVAASQFGGVWSDAQLDALLSELHAQTDDIAALSDAQVLLSLLASAVPEGRADDAQLARVRSEAATLVGTAQQFRARKPLVQAFALSWLDTLLFEPADVDAPVPVAEKLADLIAAWPHSAELRSSRSVRAKTLGGVTYGYQVEWSAAQADVDGTQVWIDFATEWFDASGRWLGERSAGASEPEDD